MKVDILISDPKHPILPKLYTYSAQRGYQLAFTQASLTGGDFLFLLSCTEIIPKEVRDRYKHTLVLHESDLPNGRGWSPLAWQILEGKSVVTVTLLEAEDKVDSGKIWVDTEVGFMGHELAYEISDKVFEAKTALMDYAVAGPHEFDPYPQLGEPTHYRRRTPEDSRLDPHKTIAEQFNLLRICEPRFPAFFEHRGHKYIVTVTKA